MFVRIRAFQERNVEPVSRCDRCLFYAGGQSRIAVVTGPRSLGHRVAECMRAPVLSRTERPGAGAVTQKELA